MSRFNVSSSITSFTMKIVFSLFSCTKYYTKQIKNCFSCIFLGIRKLGHYNWWAIACLMLAMKVRNAHISWALKCFMFLIGILFHWTWLEQIEWEIDQERKKNALMRKHSIKEEWFSVSMRFPAISEGDEQRYL